MTEFLKQHWDEILVLIGVGIAVEELYRNGFWVLGLGLLIASIGVAHILHDSVEIRPKQRNREENRS